MKNIVYIADHSFEISYQFLSCSENIRQTNFQINCMLSSTQSHNIFHMEFEGLSNKQTEDLFTLSEICGIELDKARKLLEKADFNLEQATQMHFNPQAEPAYQPVYEPQQQYPMHEQYQNGGLYESDFDQSQDPPYARYRNFRFSGRSFETNYPTASTGIKGVFTWVANKFKGDNSAGERFKEKLEQVFPKTNKINFQKGSFLDAMHFVKKQKFPLLVLIHDFSHEGRPLLKNLISNTSMADFFNTTFRMIGFDVESYQADELLRPRVDKKNIPCIAVFKVDECEEIVIMDVVELVPQTDFKELKKRLNASKSKYIKDQIKQSEYIKRFNNEMNGNYDSNPMSFEKRLELNEQRRIKQIQQKQLIEHNLQLEKKKKEQEAALRQQKQRQLEGDKKIEQRKITRENFTIYKEGIRIRLRLPNGNQLMVSVPDHLKVQYLFDYVDCQEEIGLEQDVDRKFDIIRPYDKLTLSGSKNKTFREVFGETDSESLVVNEL